MSAAGSIYERLAALDLDDLSDEERAGALFEIREQLSAINCMTERDVDALTRKLALLRMWQKLVRLRVADLQSDRPPPFERLEPMRLFEPEPEPDPELEPAAAEAEHPPVVGEDAPDEVYVPLRLTEAGVVRGVRLPAGITIEATREDAESLVEAGKAVMVRKARKKPDEESETPETE